MVRHDSYRHLRGPRWGMAGYTRYVVSIPSIHYSLIVFKYTFEGCRVSGRVGVAEVSCGIKSSVVSGLRVSFLTCKTVHLTWIFFFGSG